MIERDWLAEWMRPLIVATMIAAVALSWISLFSLASPDWNGSYLVVLCFVASLEAFVSRRLLRAHLHRLDAKWKYRAAELLVLYFILQVVANLSEGRTNPIADIPRFDPATLLSFLLIVFCWLAALWTAGDLEELAKPSTFYPGYIPPGETLTKRFFVGGVLILFGAGLSRIHVDQLFNLSRPPVSGLVVNVLVYFVLGTVMLGQMQYTTLTQRWQQQGARISEGLGGRWLRLSALFLGLVALIAFLLPTGYTVGLLDTGRFLLSILVAVFTFLLSVVMAPFLWLLSLLNIGPSEGAPEITPPTLPPVPPAGAESGGFDLFGLLRSLLFWVMMIAIVVYMLRSYVRHGGGLGAFLSGLAPIRLLGLLRAVIMRRLRGYADVVGARLARRPTERSTGVRSGRRLPWSRNPGTLSPREQVLYYYLDAVRRAGEEGYPRRPNQTPQEYGHTLEPQLPDARAEVKGLTEAFIEARYSPHKVPPEQAGQARSYWQRLGDALRGLRRGAGSGETPGSG